LFSSFGFGKQLFTAMNAYKAGNYIEADAFLDSALSIKNNDFTAQFWKIRTAFMQQNYEKALQLIAICKEFMPSVELEKLLEPWEKLSLTYAANPHGEKEDLTFLNHEADDMLEYYQHKRSYSLKECVYVVLFGFAVLFFLGFISWYIDIRSVVFSEYLAILQTIIYTLTYTYFYYNKPALVPNIYISIQYGLARIGNLFYSSNFLTCMSLLFFWLLIIQSGLKNIGLPYDSSYRLFFMVSMFLSPIMEEIIFRGFFYGYLIRYGKIVCWVLVTVIFLTMIGAPSVRMTVLSIICLIAYDRERTILAPLLLHLMNNTLFLFRL